MTPRELIEAWMSARSGGAESGGEPLAALVRRSEGALDPLVRRFALDDTATALLALAWVRAASALRSLSSSRAIKAPAATVWPSANGISRTTALISVTILTVSFPSSVPTAWNRSVTRDAFFRPRVK